jgi:hypothetical protein
MQQDPFSEDKFVEDTDKDSNFNFGALFWGLIVLSLGIAYLGDSYGVVKLNIGIDFSALWAICLIAVGLSVFSTKEWLSFSLGLFTTIMAVLVAMISIFVIGQSDVSDVNKKFVFEKYEGTDKITLNINQTAGKLGINGGLERFLMEGFFESNFTNFEIDNKKEGREQIISVSSGTFWKGIGTYYKTMNLNLNNYTIYNLNLYSNTSSVNLNLTDVMMENLNLDVYGTDIYVLVGKKNSAMNIKVKANASLVSIAIPLDMEVEILQTNNNVTALDYSDLIKINETTYRTPNYKEGENSVHIILDSTVSRFNLVR